MRRAGRVAAAFATTVVLTITTMTTGAVAAVGPVTPVGAPVDIATGLDVPWSILQLHDADGTVLVSERDTGIIQRVTAAGGLDPLFTVPGVHHVDGGEGGLLGLATLVQGGTRWIYAYHSTTTDNRIVRMVYNDPGDPEDATLGPPQVILSGLKVSKNHNGGRIAFGPDGMLYATVGDVNITGLAQDTTSLNGKILRMTPTGGVPAGNPFAGSLVWSMGHRHPQGLAWDADGQLWATEFGQNTWDEFNRIVPGGNYGWPTAEGTSGDPRFIDPWVQWSTSTASPSGLAYIDGTFFMAALGGKRLWTITVDEAAGTARATASYVDTLGRLRDVAEGPGGTLWILTNNTARGTTRPGDDRIVQVRLASTQLSRDLTGDGAPDLLARTGAGALVASPGATPPAFGAAQTLASNWRPVLTAQVGDFDGDLHADVVGRDASGALRLFRGDGAGGLTGSTRLAADWRTQNLVIGPGDWNSDGFPDLISRDTAGRLWLWPGAPGGRIRSSKVALGTGWGSMTAIVPVGDMSGDGRPDLVARTASGDLRIYRGNGSTGFASNAKLAAGWQAYTAVLSLGDVSGDGLPDLLARDSSGALWLFRGTAAGGLRSRVQLAGSWNGLSFAS